MSSDGNGNGDKITPQNVHIHLSYLREDVKEIKDAIPQNLVKVEEIFTEMKDREEKHDEKVERLIKEFAQQFVRKEEFTPVKSIAFGLVAIVMTGVVGSLIVLVVKSQ